MMRDYGLADYGLILSRDTMKLLASKICDNYSDEAYEEDEYEFNETIVDKVGAEYVGEFTGEARVITVNGYDGCDEYDYDADVLYYVSCTKYPTLFSKAYSSIDAVIREMREKVGKYLPEDFNYMSNICHIVGTYYG